MRSRAFSLVEFVVVLAIVVILASLLVPAAMLIRDKRDASQARNTVTKEKLPWINTESPALRYVEVDQFTSPDGYRIIVFRYAGPNVTTVVLPPLSAVEAE